MKKVTGISLVLVLVGFTVGGFNLALAQEGFEDGYVEGNYTKDELWGDDFYEYGILDILYGLKEGTVAELTLFSGDPDYIGIEVARNNFTAGKSSLRHAFKVLFDVAGDANYNHLVIKAGEKSQTSYMQQDRQAFMQNLSYEFMVIK